jgi:hypothetical protein
MAIGAIIGGVASIASSLIGGKARKDESEAAEAAYQADIQALRNTSFTNPYAGLENVYEDATINQQEAQFKGQQADAALRQALDAAVIAGGGPGGAQAIAQAALQSKAGISADIAKQERQNQLMAMGMEANLQSLQAQGKEDLQTAQSNQKLDLATLSAGRKRQINQARQFSTAQLGYGLGKVIGGVGDLNLFNSENA